MSAANPSTAASSTLPNGATEKKLTFKNPEGELLTGYFVDTGSKNVVLLCHGYMANHRMCNFPAIAAGLAAAGLSSFRFDHPCAWRGESELHGPFLMGNHDDEVADMQAAAEFMRNEHGQMVIALLGHSKGGTNVIQYAAQLGDIPKVINLSGRFFVRQGVLQRFGSDILDKLAATPEGIPRVESDGFGWIMKYEDFMGRAERPMNNYAIAIKDRIQQGKLSFLSLHGRQDTTIPWEESEHCSAMTGGELIVIDGDHNYRKGQHAQQMVNEVVAFCTRNS